MELGEFIKINKLLLVIMLNLLYWVIAVPSEGTPSPGVCSVVDIVVTVMVSMSVGFSGDEGLFL